MAIVLAMQLHRAKKKKWKKAAPLSTFILKWNHFQVQGRLCPPPRLSVPDFFEAMALQKKGAKKERKNNDEELETVVVVDDNDDDDGEEDQVSISVRTFAFNAIFIGRTN